MKKLFCLALALMLALSCAIALAEENLPEINFRGYEFGSTVADVKKAMKADGAKGSFQSGAFTMAGFTGVTIDELASGEYDFYNNTDSLKGIMVSYNDYDEIEVAGYKALSWLLFVRPVQSGEVVGKEDDAIFYAGCYSIDCASENRESIFNDFTNKLSGLYGDAVVEVYLAFWYGAGDTKIVLNAKPDSSFIQLTYVWCGADELIEEAFNTIPEPEDISNNTNGL